MKQKLRCILFLGCFLFACSGDKIESLADFMEIDDIEQVRMSNNSGTFYLNDKQLISLKKELKSLSYDPGFSAKVGAITMELTIHGKKHVLSSATHGDYLEVHSSIASKNKAQVEADSWLYFKTNGVNFDNYTKQ